MQYYKRAPRNVSWVFEVRLKGFSRLGMLLVLAVSVLPVMMGYANAPTVLKMEIETRGEANFLIIHITHSSPTSTHFVGTAEVEVGDKSVIHLDLGAPDIGNVHDRGRDRVHG